MNMDFTTDRFFYRILTDTHDSAQTDDGKTSCTTIQNVVLNFVLPISMSGSVDQEAQQANEVTETCAVSSQHLQQPLEVLTGSSSEGLGLPEVTELDKLNFLTESSDRDIKYVFTSLVVDDNYRKAFARPDTSYSHPGFTRLLFNEEWLHRRKVKQNKFYEERERLILACPQKYVSTDNFINRKHLTRILRKDLADYIHSTEHETSLINFRKGIQPSIKFSYHGPAITVEIEVPGSNVHTSKDYVVALPCPKWPDVAQEWKSRERNWPPRTTVKAIVKRGCHIVPKAYHSSSDPYEFIFSFSVTEKYVAKCLSIYQKRVYHLMKFLFKYCLNKVNRGLTTYHIKTTFFRLCEKVPQDQWTESNPSECLKQLLNDLEHYIQNGFLPHYFIPALNLVDNVTPKSLKAIAADIAMVKLDFWYKILQLTETNRFCWLSRDISLPKVLQPSLSNTNDQAITLKLCQTAVLKFLSSLLLKGEVHVAISLLCGTTNCEKLPPVQSIITTLETVINLDHTQTDVTSLTGLLAVLYHQQAMEHVTCCAYQSRKSLTKSAFLFKECLKNTGEHLWIVSEYYNLLSVQENNPEIVRHFVANLYQSKGLLDLYQGGVYTIIDGHNYLTSGEVFIEAGKMAEFYVPSTAYIFYKVYKSIANLAGESNGNQRSKLEKFNDKLLKDFQSWTQEKFSRFPEELDEHVHILLALCYKIRGQDKKAEQYYTNAVGFNGTYRDYYDDIIIDEEMPIKKVKPLTKDQIRLHPYKLPEYCLSSYKPTKRIKQVVSSKLFEYRKKKMTINKFVHLQ